MRIRVAPDGLEEMTSRSRLISVTLAAGGTLLLATGTWYLTQTRQPSESQPVGIAPSPTAQPLSPSIEPTPPPSPTAQPTPIPVEMPLPGAERFALVVFKGCSPPGPPPYVRREDSHEIIAELGQGYLCGLRGDVSPDGRRLAYWISDVNRSEIAIYQGGSSVTILNLGSELMSSLVWSVDGTGLLFVAMVGGVQGVPPEYAALRTLDIASGSVKELTRVTGGCYLGAIAWDRSRRVAAAVASAAANCVNEYLMVTEDQTIERAELPAGVTVRAASPDATLVVGHWRIENVIRYWPIDSFEDQKELRSPPGAGAVPWAWRPGTLEIAVTVTSAGIQSLELWSLDGARRRITDYHGQDGGLFFRPDGSVIFIGSNTAIDVESGQSTLFDFKNDQVRGAWSQAASLLR